MRFFLQTGHGMMALNREFVDRYSVGGNLGVVIWPRTLTRAQVETHAADLRARGAVVFFDPCFYMPRTVLTKILDYPYWDGIDFATTEFAGPVGEDFCRRVISYQVDTLKVSAVLLPGQYTDVRNETWLRMHRLFADTAAAMKLAVPVYSTLALGPDVLRDRPTLDALLNEFVDYPVDGYYVLCRSPDDEFLSTDDLFLTNQLRALLSLSLTGKRVLRGYGNQQDLAAAAAGVEDLASGNFRNVRSFNPSIFEDDDDSDRKRAIWYYDGNSLSEFRPQQLATAFQLFGIKPMFGPSTPYAAPLLLAENPANVRWTEPEPFRHFLTVLKDQWLAVEPVPRRDRATYLRGWLDARKSQLAALARTGFPLGERSAANSLNSTLNALDAFIALDAKRIAML